MYISYCCHPEIPNNFVFGLEILSRSSDRRNSLVNRTKAVTHYIMCSVTDSVLVLCLRHWILMFMLSLNCIDNFYIICCPYGLHLYRFYISSTISFND